MHERPGSMKAIFLLTVAKILLCAGFYVFFTLHGPGPIGTELILYTGAAYVALAIPTFIFIHSRNGTGVRICIALSILASIPAGAAAAILIDLICLTLSLRAPARKFFASRDGQHAGVSA